LASISAQRRSEPGKLGALLRGELDWIVMKALEKDRTRRYASASDFSRDVQRYLHDEAVEACPPSMSYRMQKLVRRHKGWIAAAATLAAVLLIATAVSVASAIRANNAMIGERRARQEREAQLRLTETERRRAVLAQRQAKQHRERALEAAHAALDQLGKSRYLAAKAVLASDEPGRRWTALNMLRGAEGLRARQGAEQLDELLTGERKPTIGEAMGLAAALGDAEGELSPAELRTQAVAALLLPDGRVAQQWEGHFHSVSPDGRYVATTLLNPKPQAVNLGIRIIEAATGREVASPRPKAGPPLLAAVSLRAESMAAFSLTPALELIDLAGDKKRRTLSIPGIPDTTSDRPGPQQIRFQSMLDTLQFSPDGKWLAATRSGGGASSEVILWRLTDPAPAGRVLATTEQRPQSRPAFSPDSRRLAWVSGEREVVLWSLADEQDERRLNLPLLLDVPIAFTPDGARLAAHGHRAKADQEAPPQRPSAVLIWDIAEDRLVEELDTTMTFLAIAIGVSQAGDRVAVGQMSGELLVFDLADASQSEDMRPRANRPSSVVRLDHGAMPTSLRWTPEGRLISAGIGVAKAWELVSPTALAATPLPGSDPLRPISRLAVSPSGGIAAVERPGARSIQLYDLNAGKLLRSLESPNHVGLPSASLLFGPRGRRLVRIAFNRVYIWDLEGDGKPHAVDDFQGSLVTNPAFRDDGTLLLCGFDQFRPAVKEALTGDVVWMHDEKQPRAIPRISRDGSLIAFHSEKEIGRGPRTIELRRLPTGDVLHRIPSARTGFNFQTVAEIAPDNRWLMEIEIPVNFPLPQNNPLSGGFSSQMFGGTSETWRANIWSIETGRQHWQFEGDSKTEAVAFSPDGRYFAAAQRNGNVGLWDIEQKQRLFHWQAWPGAAQMFASSRDLSFTGDGRLFVAAESEAALRILDLRRLNQELAEIGLGW
ncbi:MAG: hypothetical protein KY475_15470, partial [Planctomycetes bacterium]|nr:hypothetical protein [Planctomycetota bacterium]